MAMTIVRCFSLTAGNRKVCIEQIEMEVSTEFCLSHLQWNLFHLTLGT